MILIAYLLNSSICNLYLIFLCGLWLSNMDNLLTIYTLTSNTRPVLRHTPYSLGFWHITLAATICRSTPHPDRSDISFQAGCHGHTFYSDQALTSVLGHCTFLVSTMDTSLDLFHLMDLGLNCSGSKDGRTLIWYFIEKIVDQI